MNMDTSAQHLISELDPQPRPPQEPDHEDCCGEGCVPCIWDTYDRKVQRYEDRMAAWRKRHPDAVIDDDA